MGKRKLPSECASGRRRRCRSSSQGSRIAGMCGSEPAGVDADWRAGKAATGAFGAGCPAGNLSFTVPAGLHQGLRRSAGRCCKDLVEAPENVQIAAMGTSPEDTALCFGLLSSFCVPSRWKVSRMKWQVLQTNLTHTRYRGRHRRVQAQRFDC
jgi:hypothetical protein